MDFQQFLDMFEKRVNSYVSRQRYRFRLPSSYIDDLRQAAYLGILEALPRWSPSGGMSAFNWCAGPMRRQMERVIRSYLGMKPCSVSELKSEDMPLTGCEVAISPNIENVIDVRRLIESDSNQKHVARFVISVLSPSSGGDLARAENITRQGINWTNQLTKKRLRAAYG